MEDYPILTRLDGGEDIRTLNMEELYALCDEIRRFLILSVSKTGGHLASNLGVVELTVALHYVFHLPEDKLVFDVGHQCYAHKMLSGRWKQFDTLRQKDGIAGFPRTCESEYDAFIAGHSSTSISAAYGLSTASALSGSTHHTVAVIGDGAFTGGMVYEAMNNAGKSMDNLIVVLNHNEMSISANVGAVAKYFNKIRKKPHYLRMKQSVDLVVSHLPLVGKPLRELLLRTKAALKHRLYGSTLFEDLGFHYQGPVDGHRLESLIWEFNRAKSLCRPVIVHVDTVKGKGFTLAEQNPGAFHGISQIDLDHPDVAPKDSFSTVAGQALSRMADRDTRICAVTAAMKYGTGLQYFAKAHRSRFFDVGIAEEHAVTFCSGLAAGGMLPVFAVYSTFLQRGYDQLIHDASIEPRHLVLAIDRAGVVGQDGETHQGIFDVAFLRSIPGMTVYAPSDYAMLEDHLHRALYRHEGVVAVRYPRGTEKKLTALPDKSESGAYRLFGGSGEILIVTYGQLVNEALTARTRLAEEGITVSVLQPERILPFPEEALEIALSYRSIFFFEEGIESGGAAEGLLALLSDHDYNGEYHLVGIRDFVPQATVQESLSALSLDANGMIRRIKHG